MKVVVVGGGIAGASVAYWAGQAGLEVVLIDAGQHTASCVPAALLNPVRGQSGKVAPRMVEGLHLTWSLVERLSALSPIPHGRSGLWRPVPDEKTRLTFERHLNGQALAWHWKSPQPPLQSGWHATLELPQGGWVDGQALIQALALASGAQRISGRVSHWNAQAVTLEDGSHYAAKTVVWCGGAVGTAQHGSPNPASHRAGHLLTLAQSPADLPLSFGVYATPAAKGGVLGATFESPRSQWQPPLFPASSLQWLLAGGERLLNLRGLKVAGHWSGTRLSGLRAGRMAAGHWELSGLGSKGFLLGPLLARELVSAITQG